MLQRLRFLRSLARAAAAAGVLALAGCGGGVYLGDNCDDDDDDDEPPQISLVVSPSVAAPGDTLRLAAAASDDSGIDEVIFFRVDGALSTEIGSDDTSPFEIDDAVLPDDADGTVQFFARAVDNDGDERDSDLVSVSVDR